MTVVNVMLPKLVRPDDYRPGKLTRWQPKKWDPVYEQVVALSCANKTNKEIGTLLGYTEVHIGNILRSRLAEALKIQIYEKLRENVSKTIGNCMADAAIVAARRINDVLQSDELAAKHPLSIFDRSLQVLKVTRNVSGGESGPSGVVNIQEGGKANIIITSEAAGQLKDAIRLSDEGRKALSDGSK